MSTIGEEYVWRLERVTSFDKAVREAQLQLQQVQGVFGVALMRKLGCLKLADGWPVLDEDAVARARAEAAADLADVTARLVAARDK